MKMASQRFCLRWNNHQSNLLSVFDQLLHAETFTDVTLAVDGQYLKAHKMVLSACSPYFNALFLNHPEKHPIVILKDVPYADMKSLLDFMYRGEVSVDQERLTAFLRVAESLRIKGLTEVNDDKPSNNEPTPQPPQLQRIQPYVVQQQQQQQQQRHKTHQNNGGSPLTPAGNQQQQQKSQQESLLTLALASMPKRKRDLDSSTPQIASVTGQQQQKPRNQQQQQQQQQESLLTLALASMPKRKRGKPRRLSGSDDADYDEFDGEMAGGDGKMCNDSYSGNEDASDDNQRDSGNNDDLNESRDSLSPSKKAQMQQERHQQNDDNSTSVHLITSSPELSQRLFGITSSNSSTVPTNTNNNIVTSNTSMISLVPQNRAAAAASSSAPPPQAIEFNDNINVHLPTVLGLKFKNTMQQQQELANQTQGGGGQQQQQSDNQHMTMTITSSSQPLAAATSSTPSTNPNSLLKQQLRAGLKDLIDVTLASVNASNNNCNSTITTTANSLNQQTAPSSNNDLVSSTHMDTQEACSALQSLANAAERQAAQNNNNSIQPPSANNLHHQFLLHMAANPIMKSGGDFFQQHQNALLLREDDNNLDLLMDQSDKSDPEMLTLADENAGLDYSTGNEGGGGGQGENNENFDSSHNNSMNHQSAMGQNCSTPRSKNGKPVQRRRVRRKAQSSIDDQAEQLTEMSVRGLDLFRYASVTEGVYQCTECAKENMQKTFKNKYSFQRHAFLYHEGKHRKVFPCPLCGKEFSRPDKMKNHMKMTHASFMAKEIQNFNPLNYLISAAAADEIQANFGNNTNAAGNNITNTNTSQPPLISQLQSSNPALSIMINNNTNPGDNNEEFLQHVAQQEKENLAQQLKLPTDIEIKNEIVISPSPSPPPPPPTSSSAAAAATATSSTMLHQLPSGTSVSLAETSSLSLLKSAATTTNAQLNAQRLEEVK
ncbi:zinc finger and BTB domain-containing protein ttk isoform X1 [Musca autumnalis]|uniref:zinc finger and BTB domain-containing protein ttk isoform X1 n=1 Tax=Musca autumnalis TaxID=221902 RepID=UPI003CECA032